MGYTVIFDAVHISLKGELGLFKSIMYFRSKRFFSIFWPFDVNLKWFDLWKHFRNVAWSFHSWKFQRVDYYTAWSNSTKFVEKRDLPNHGQTCGHRFADVNWRIPNPTLLRSRRVSWFLQPHLIKKKNTQPHLIKVAKGIVIPPLRRHGGTALFKSMTEQLCWRQNLGPPLKNDPN